MYKFKKFIHIPMVLFLAEALTGCGGQSYQTSASGSTSNITSSTSSTSSTTTTTSTTAASTAAYTRSYTLIGARMGAGNGSTPPSGSTVTVMSGIVANSILTIDVSANSTGSITSSGTNMYDQCVGFDIAITYGDTGTVGATQTVYVPADSSTSTCYNGSTATTTLDFSSYLNQGHTGGISVVISNAYSNTCGSYYYNLGKYYCTWQQLLYQYQFTGTIKIHTDTTS